KLTVFASVSAAFAGADAAAAAGAAEGVKFSTSFLTIRPPSAEPFTCERSIPFSLAIFFANGEAFTRESDEVLLAASGAGLVYAGASAFFSSDLSTDFAAGF